MDTPIGQFVLIGNFRRRLARELLVLLVWLIVKTDAIVVHVCGTIEFAIDSSRASGTST